VKDRFASLAMTDIIAHERSRRLRLPILILLLTLPFTAAFKNIPQGASEAVLQDAATGQRLIFERNYSEAQKHFWNLAHKYPSSPLGTFGEMALYNAMMFENYDFSLDKGFAQVSHANKLLVDKILKDENASAWDLFLCGASSGLRGFYLIRKDQALKAFGEAGAADKCLEAALKKDPQFMDTYLGTGMSKFWRSVFTQQFKGLPFIKDRRSEGIDEMKKAIAEGTIANELGRAALMFVYLQNNQFRPGLAEAETILKDYPQNVIAQLHKGRFQLSLGQTQPALKTFNELLQNDPKITVALYFKARALMNQGKTQEAQTVLEQFVKAHPNEAWRAYGYYQLGHLALKRGDRKAAYDYFKKGHHDYGAYKPNLEMLLKLRAGKARDS
jgi:tetratricopeptide (TPR) repeat protein